MKNQLFLLLISFLTFNSYSQIVFEKGFFITNSGEKNECLIKNIAWKNNPIAFEYKKDENSTIETATIQSVKEFEIYNSSRYIRETVKIDQYSQTLDNLSTSKEPIFVEKQLFLKVLIQGKANLYSYDGNIFFYNVDNSKIEQLIYKSYYFRENEIAKNDQFKQQLFNAFNGSEITINRLINIEYKKNSLIPIFEEYNKYQNSEFINFEKKEKKDLFNISIRPRINNSSLEMKNYFSDSGDLSFGNKINFGFGIEFEYIFPFNKNKWSLSTEPTYQNFKSEVEINESKVSGGKLIAKVDYTSVEIPITIRHYFFLNKNSKIFANISVIFDRPIKSAIELTRADGSNLNTIDVNSPVNFSLGLGYKLNDKFSLEMRAFSNRNITSDYIYIPSDYKNLSLIFGYTIL